MNITRSPRAFSSVIALGLAPFLIVGCDQSTPESAPVQASEQAPGLAREAAPDSSIAPAADEEPTASTSTFKHSGSDDEQTTGLQRSFSEAATAKFNLLPTIRMVHDASMPLAHQQVIYTILSFTNEKAIHQMRDETGNQVYLAGDGREGVYDANGDLLANGYNDGTYNYADWQEEPLLHFTMDISPWIELGISATDPTSVKERIYAYMGDLETGIIRAQDRAPLEALSSDHRFLDLGQSQAIAIFYKVIEAGQAQELYTLFEDEHTLTREELYSVLSKINTGFEIIYGVPQP